MKFLNQGNTGEDKNHAHDEGSDYAPEQYLMLKLGRYAEIRKNHNEDKNIVNTERFFHQIPGKKLQCLLLSLPEINDCIENQGKKNPDQSPG